MRARMPYVQLWKGSYRFRRKVPLQHRQTVGKPEWIRPLGSKHRPIRDRSEANRLAVPHIAETNAILEALKNGTWQERSDTDIRCPRRRIYRSGMAARQARLHALDRQHFFEHG